ncbi:MAG: endonuclease/exonuclease/phosphatase family protein [Acidobacteriota bacterium]
MKLRVATYNIHRAIGLDRRFRPQRIVDLLAAHDPDIALLQEVDDGVPRSRRLDLARELADALSFSHWAVGHNHVLRQGRYGNATLSRFPIRRERNIDLTIGRFRKRGCQHTTLELARGDGPTQSFEVFNLHLGLSAWERRRQTRLLAASPEITQLQPSVPCMVGGDFNDWRSQLRSFFVAGLGFRCATDRKGPEGQPRAMRTFPSFAPRGPLDRLYLRGPITIHRVFRSRHRVAQVASDHLPVFADLEIQDENRDSEASGIS